jgi:hypothetical protein
VVPPYNVNFGNSFGKIKVPDSCGGSVYWDIGILG